MCGIAGVWNTTAAHVSSVGQMLEYIGHRGPDHRGIESGPGWSIGHNRLSIIDLKGGNQPIWNEDESIFIVGNNEIYNAPQLRGELEALGHRFRTHSDTEVALHAYEAWGTRCFARLNGMYALVIVDAKRNAKVLARDPLGIKPMHVMALPQGGWAYASEIKAFLGLAGVALQPDADAIHLFMNFRYVPDDRTLFKGIRRIAPGSYLELHAGEGKEGRFKELRDTSSAHIPDFDADRDTLRDMLSDAVKRHLISDVEVACYLSGGIDSSTVASFANEHHPRLRTFCVGFNQPTDENRYATEFADRIGTTHTNIMVPDDPFSMMEKAVWHVEEPKVNSLQGMLLTREVAKNVKVALSGQGGDELFAGYVNNDILYPMAVASSLHRTPKGARWDWLRGLVSAPSFQHAARAAELLPNLCSPVHYYAILRNCFDHSPRLMSEIYASPRPEWHGMSARVLAKYYDMANDDVMNELLLMEMRTKLPNDFLLTEDRVSMAHSLETRVPLLDIELVDFALGLPSRLKYRPGNKKRIMKAAVRARLGDAILHRRKWGFSFDPVAIFASHIRPFALETLTRKKVEDMGIFNWRWIETTLDAPVARSMRWHYFNLWVMAGFALWFDLFISRTRRVS
jgi:asparagine synthase (glutamine-hydrolysing)